MFTTYHEPATWTEKCPGCKHTFGVTPKTNWNQCAHCEGLYCQRCVTLIEGHPYCFACAEAVLPEHAPCDNCRAMTAYSQLGEFYPGGEEQRLRHMAAASAEEWGEAAEHGPLTVCPKCFRGLEAQRLAGLRRSADRAGAAELAAIVRTFGSASFREVR